MMSDSKSIIVFSQSLLDVLYHIDMHRNTTDHHILLDIIYIVGNIQQKFKYQLVQLYRYRIVGI